MAIELQTRKLWTVENVLSVAGTAEKMGAGGANDTFEPTAKFIEIAYATHDCYLAPTEAALADTPDGSATGGRVFVKAAQPARVIPWESKNVWFLNAVGGEKPTVYINGMF